MNPRISIVHQHTNNFGDDAAGLALIGSIREIFPDAEIDVFYIWHRGGSALTGAGTGTRHHMLNALSGDKERRPEWAARAAVSGVRLGAMTPEIQEMVEICRASDHVFVSPAGSNLGIYKDWMYLLSLYLLVRNGVQLTFCQNSIHASGSSLFDRIAHRVLANSKVYVRETASAAHLQREGIRSVLGVDTALAAPFPVRTRDEGRTLTVVPTNLASWHRDHRGGDDASLINGKIGGAVKQFAKMYDYQVELLAHLYGPEDEADMLNSLRDELCDAGVSCSVTQPESANAYKLALCNADLVLSMRYHGLVLAGHAAVPCVALAYENKMVEAAGYLGLKDLCLDVNAATKDDIIAALTSGREQSESIIFDLKRRRHALQEVAKSPTLALLATAVRDNPRGQIQR
ncbi:polysaccharide pyruvyl transferase family protein [Calidifontibacter terrae]